MKHNENTSKISMSQRLKQHPLISSFLSLEGNPKACILMEPLWGIPYNLIIPFASLYMRALGVTDIKIGLILSVAMIFQFAFSFAGGILTDKIGRKATTMLGDLVGWCLGCAVWAVSQNFWFFIAAVVLNSFEQINQTAWHCLLTEDADSSEIVPMYTWIIISGLLAVFIAPISGMLIKRFSLVPVMRVLYAFFSFNMIIKTILTAKYTKETQAGIKRKEACKNLSMLTMFKQYKNLLPEVAKNKTTIQTLVILVISLVTTTINSNFFAVYANENLFISQQTLAFFPIIRAIIMIVFIFGVDKLLNRRGIKIPLALGFVIYLLCMLALILSPPKSMFMVLIYVLLESFAAALVSPRKESMLILNVEPEERARVTALLTALMIAFSVPFGYISGLLSSFNRRLPFILSMVLFAAAFVVVLKMKEPDTSSNNEEELIERVADEVPNSF